MNDTHPFFARRLSRRQLVVLDLVAGLCLAFLLFTVMVNAVTMPPWMRLALPLGLGLPLAVRRVWPMPVFCLTLVLALYAALVGAVGLAYLAPAYALYIVALSDRLGAVVPTSAIAAVSLVTVLGLTVAGTSRVGAPDWVVHLDQPLLGIGALGGAWTIGRAVQERRSYAAREAERLAAQAVTEERLRLARELHDVVTHSVGLIAIKAGVANHVLASRPQEAHDALRVIETASRSALVEMRHLLGVLRSSDAPDRAPAPGPAGIERLVEQARLAGVDVDLDLHFASDAAAGGSAASGSATADAGASGSGGGGSAVRGSAVGGPVAGGLSTSSGAGSSAGGSPGGNSVVDGHVAGGRVLGGRAVGGFAVRGSTDGGSWAGGAAAGSSMVDGHVAGGRAVGGSAAGGSADGGSSAGRVGDWARLPEGVGLSVYRIVQEALTNVVKHAAPARCRVSVVADEKEVRIEVLDDGPRRRTSPSDGSGHGLIGMRERVSMYGGTFEAGSRRGRGFRVFATLPYGEVL
ncbi:histidine kinase [Nonomuraea sp. NPDC049504]|uniref:sensor histidine kinase n=1 Tax=Nonomuraea sp. NPDC049504 TaxID=3154729 RepID=UPI00343688D5